jgi:uncharacterized membrane protein YkoI
MKKAMKVEFALAGLCAALLVAGCQSTKSAGSPRSDQGVEARATRVDAQQALAAATAAVPGRAQDVRLESRDGKPEYAVIVLPAAGGSPVRVEVDAASGQVMKSEAAEESAREDDEDDD